MKKVVIFTIISLVLIILTLVGVFCATNKKLSKDNFISLMNSFDEISNVKIEGSMTKYIKDEYMLSIRKDGLYTWANSKTRECIGYFPSSKMYDFIEYVDSDATGLEDFEYTFIRI